MKDFNDFLEKHSFPRSKIADMLFSEYESLHTQKDESTKIIAASIVTMQKVMDMRLKAYHQWLHSSNNQ